MTKRPFVLLQAASLASFIDGSSTFILVPLLALQTTGSSALAALVIGASAVPSLLITPFVGGLIDRFGRRRLAIWTELTTGLAVACIPLVAATIGMNVWWLVLLTVLRSIFGAGSVSARKALLPDVAEKAGMTLDRANSIGEAVSSAGFAIGPAIAATILNKLGIEAGFWAAAIAALLSAFFAWMIRVPEKQEAVEGDPEESKHPISYALQGFVILGKLPQLLIVFLSFCILAIVYIPTEMVVLPRFYNSIGQPALTGYLITAMSIFTVFGSLAFEKLVKVFGYANTVRFGLLGIGIPMLPMSQLPDYGVMILLGTVLGFAWGPMMPILNTLIQTMVPANIRGRVFAVEGVMWNIAPLTSFILVGVGLDTVGVKPVYLTLAILVTLFSLVISFSPQLRSLNRVAAEAKATAEAA